MRGISLFRAACLNHPDDILAHVKPEKLHENGIVRISVGFLRSIGLSVESKPIDEIMGHVVIPELNAMDYSADRKRFDNVKELLASAAGEEANILRRPTFPAK